MDSPQMPKATLILADNALAALALLSRFLDVQAKLLVHEMRADEPNPQALRHLSKSLGYTLAAIEHELPPAENGNGADNGDTK